MNVTGVIFDWAGTLVDYGSRAPVAAMQEVFEAAGVPVEVEEVRLSMGLAKRDHLCEILELPRVSEAWEIVHGALPCDADVDELYADFVEKQMECLGAFARLIPGVTGAAEGLRARGVMLGSSTGYTREMLDFLLDCARSQGFEPDCAVSPEDVPGGGRPNPWMCYLNAIRLEIAPMWTMVKIGDTQSDIEEGLNAGMWTIGITRTGNEIGMTEEEWVAISPEEQRALIEQAEGRLMEAGAHYLAESVGDCVELIDDISERLEAGERP